jgi:DNA (cytosine-5)-methyltransferase 3A
MVEPKFDLNVTLSLFDGISCGQEALKKAGLSTRIFLASEIEKYPKMITRKNHPLTVQLGDVRDVKGENLPKVDLIFAGSPCQDVSFAGKGKGLIKGERSNLFFEFVRILEECRKFNPDVKFLLENVKMRKEYETIISEHLGVEPVMINSSLISAQNRKRLYWTNIPGVGQPDDLQIDLVSVLEEDATEPMLSNIYGGFGEKKPRVHTGKSVTIRAASGGGHIPSVTIKQPKDKGILLKDVLEESPEDYTLMSDRFVNRNKDAGCLVDSDKPKASNLSAMEYVKNGRQGDYIKSDKKGRPTEPKVLIIPEQVRVRKHEVDIKGLQHCLLNALATSNKTKKQVAEELNDKFSTVEHYFRKVGSEFFCIPSEHHWFELKEILNIKTDEFDASITEFEIRDGRYDMADRVYNPEYKAPTVIASSVAKVLTHPTYRKLTPIECERLQTLPDNYTEGVSNTQRYKALGNGWTVDVIVHILQGLKQQKMEVAL